MNYLILHRKTPMNKVRHVLGISGGKDSAALAIYLNEKYPQLDIEYYFCDTGRELDETYVLVEKLETILNKKIERLSSVDDSPYDAPFDHYLEIYGGYLPSTQSRWCTRKLKLEPFEKFVGDDPVISYVGIRGDENREAYISRKPNIQSIFPFRKNIWSKDVIAKVLSNQSISVIAELYLQHAPADKKDTIIEMVRRSITPEFDLDQKLNALLEADITSLNRVIFEYLRHTEYPLSLVDNYPLLENTDILVRDDIFRILEESGVGIPKYYQPVEFNVNDQTGQYARTRSGCFFCFFQQKIEWVWLYEQHPELFEKAMAYEKDGYTWIQEESLQILIKPDRIRKIKEEHLKRLSQLKNTKSDKLLDILEDDNEQGCAACFI